MSDEETASEQFKSLMEDANQALLWAKEKAEEFLAYANELEERASRYRQLAATMIIEAREYADEMATLLLAEFPMASTGDDDGVKEGVT